MTRTTIPDTIERTAVLPQPVDRVWAALTDPEQLGRWFSQSASWELREGAPMTCGGTTTGPPPASSWLSSP